MTNNGEKRSDVDGWLTRTFPDDLPADVEIKLAAQLDRFRENWWKPEKPGDSRAFQARRPYSALAGLTLAATSAVLIVFGLTLLASKSPTALASSLAVLQKAASVSGQVGNDRVMECTVRLDRGGVTSSLYVIRWVSPEETRVRLVLDGRESVRTVRPRQTDRSVLEFVTRPGSMAVRDLPLLEAELLPVADLLTSSRLRRLLDGRWLPVGVERAEGCDRESFCIAKAPGGPSSRLTVDACTFLPTKLERELDKGGRLEADFRWEPRSGPGAASGGIPS